MSRVPREGKTLNSRSWLVGFKKRVVLLAGGSSHCWISVTELISPQKGVWEKRGWFAREREKQKEGKRMPTGRPGRVAKITHFDGIKMSVFASPIFEDSAPPELYIPPPPPPPHSLAQHLFITLQCASSRCTELLFYLTIFFFWEVGMFFWRNSRDYFKKGPASVWSTYIMKMTIRLGLFGETKLYPRFLLTFSKNKYNNIRFYNEEFLREADKFSILFLRLLRTDNPF